MLDYETCLACCKENVLPEFVEAHFKKRWDERKAFACPAKYNARFKDDKNDERDWVTFEDFHFVEEEAPSGCDKYKELT
jgi:hypothetical protein